MKDKVRKRVPVSCLNCKKRKVKCERGRPCAGCIKNNVPHLCVYLEPDWAQSSLKLVDEDPSKVSASPKEADAWRKSLESKIAAQENEIRCLRAQLELAKSNGSSVKLENVNNHFASAHSPVESSPTDIPLNVLAKLSAASKPELTVLKHGSYSMSGFKVSQKAGHHSSTPLYTIYSWLNIVKLDPHLTALWFRVTNLQKSYHLYKTSLLRKEAPSYGGHMLPSESTESSDSNSCGHHKCPVVACEFNLMLEESENTLKNPDASLSISSVDAMFKPDGCPVDRIRNSTQSSDALELLRCLQNMWGKIVGSTSNSEPLNYSQLCFLISFYLDDFDCPGSSKETLLSNETESGHLFRFFKIDIISLFVKDQDNGQPYLDLGAFSTDMSDVEVITFLQSKAVFLCMLALIVEESLDRLSERQSLSNDLVFRLQSSFPQGIPGRKFAVLSHVTDTIQFLFQSSDSPADSGSCKLAADLDGSLSMIVLLLANMNRNFSLYERQNTAVDYRAGFSGSFTKFIQLVRYEDQALQIWCDPRLVQLNDESSVNDNAMLGVLFSQIWCDFMRIVNNTIFNLLPILNSNEVHESLEYFLDIMHAAEKSANHKSFLDEIWSGIQKNDLDGLSVCQIDDLLVSLKTNYLIARCSILVRNGISLHENSALAEPLSVNHFQSLVDDIRVLSEDISLSKLRMIRFFETKTILHYLEFFFKLVMFLQFEEVEDKARISQMLPSLFANALDINKFLQGSQSRLAKGINANYVSAIIADTLARISHLMSGILLRFKVESKKEDRSNKSQFMASFSSTAQTQGNKPNVLLYSMMRPNTSSCNSFETSVTLAEKEQVIKATDETVLLLESSMPRENIIKKTKIWKFYMTFIRNAHEMNATNFARIHGEGFGPGKLLDKCPIMSGPSYELSATRGSMKCPVIGVEAPKLQASGCPFGSKRNFEQIKKEDGVGFSKCPVAHIKEESPKRANFGEEVGTSAPTPQTEAYYAKKFAPPLFANMGPTAAYMGPSGEFRQKEDMDWDSLPNFNFDFIGEEGLMSQINSGDFNNPRIENMFQ